VAPIDLKTLEITINKAGAFPNNYGSSRNLICHLNTGFSIDKETQKFGFAIMATAKAKLIGGAKAAEGWRFGFVQTHAVRAMSYYYVGETEGDGGIALEVASNPAMKSQPLLDTEPEFPPWTSSVSHTVLDDQIFVSTGDHPACKAAVRLTNRNTLKSNYLCSVYDKRELCTVFAARDPAGKMSYLAHFKWSVLYDFSFANVGPGRTRSGVTYVPMSYYSGSALSFDKVIMAAPTDPAVNRVLNTLTLPYANKHTRTTMEAVIGMDNQMGRTDHDKAFPWVPKSFYLSFFVI
jgi:hypothetical protein